MTDADHLNQGDSLQNPQSSSAENSEKNFAVDIYSGFESFIAADVDAFVGHVDDSTHRSTYDHDSMSQLGASKGYRLEACDPRFMPYTSRVILSSLVSLLVRVYLSLRPSFRVHVGRMLLIMSKPEVDTA